MQHQLAPKPFLRKVIGYKVEDLLRKFRDRLASAEKLFVGRKLECDGKLCLPITKEVLTDKDAAGETRHSQAHA